MHLVWLLCMLLGLQQVDITDGAQRELENYLLGQTRRKPKTTVDDSTQDNIGQIKPNTNAGSTLQDTVGSIKPNTNVGSTLQDTVGQIKTNTNIGSTLQDTVGSIKPNTNIGSTLQDTVGQIKTNTNIGSTLQDTVGQIKTNTNIGSTLQDTVGSIKPNTNIGSTLQDTVGQIKTNTNVGSTLQDTVGSIKPNTNIESTLQDTVGQIKTNTNIGSTLQDTVGQIQPNTSAPRGIEFPNMPDPCRPGRRLTKVKDYLCMEPLQFLSSYKNPCWRGHNFRLRCLPYFHLFGMSKSGTTDLFQRLYLHPDIVPNKAIREKETRFWTGMIFKTGNKSLEYYTNVFYTDKIEQAVDENGYHYKITGHGDPHDMWKRFSDWSIPQNDPTKEELEWTMPYLERHLNPGVKLLLMLRDPVERLYSVFYFAKQGNSSAQFDEYVAYDIALLNQCLEYHTLRHCIFDPKTKNKFKTRIYSSFYAELLRDWLRAFPREQILILRNEDYGRNISGTLAEIFTFLNVTMPHPTVMDAMASKARFFVTKAKAEAEPMSSRTRAILTDLYRQPSEELAEMLGDERFTFKDVQQSRR